MNIVPFKRRPKQKTDASLQEKNENLIAEIRSNQAFEYLVVAVVYSAVICGVIRFVASALIQIIDGRTVWGAVIAQLAPTVAYTFLIFLTGFAASAALGFPLWKRFERRGVYSMSAFYAIALVVVALSVVIKPPLTGFDLAYRLAPALVAPTLFHREAGPLVRRLTTIDN